ncbi:MAG: UDP-N-acetylmuramoyl-L-alanyl-D-glutamate--2,6-diaminopimelate ligase [Planctomycetes bacterium]|nr:UDP-N-acetylmuramoyl-L-alanyl-D-glutamate--2,6-diaminopimelate ligase [Planctomycetota bacterium]
MTFDELLALTSSPNPPKLRTDSRLVKPGDIFAAIPGTTCDGHDFMDQAVENGAKYILCQKPQNSDSAEIITVENSAKAAAVLAQTVENNPALKLTNLAVTGTNGKTTVTFLVQSIIKNANQTCGLIGTVTYDTGEQSCDASLTTPDCLTIAQKQSQMLKTGTKYMVIEASSHALDQNRLAAINFKAAAFTNLTGDHLDYHKNKENYLAAKIKLFQSLSPEATAVLNKQSPESKLIAEKTKAKILWYAIDSTADLSAHIESMDINGTVFTLEYKDQKQKVTTPLLGRYNVSNHLAAAGLCLAAGFNLETIAAGLAKLKTILGRLEKLDSPDISVIIDYAHTDDALKNVLTTLKPLCEGNLTVIFGCGGDRDKTKRPRMAEVAQQFADSIIITSDNPRTENPTDIINQITAGFAHPDSPKIKIEPDRKKAIQSAIKNAQKNDIILIAGKGHETYQIIGTEKFDFSDKKIAQTCLKQRT